MADTDDTVVWTITLEVTAHKEEFFGKPPSEWDWDEMLEMGTVRCVGYVKGPAAS